jgi:hypothetical protein
MFLVQPLGLLLRDDVQPVEVHRPDVADHDGKRRRRDLLGGLSSDGPSGWHPVAVVGELGGLRLLHHLRQPASPPTDMRSNTASK